MPSINELTKLIRKLQNQLALCSRCGMCQAVCPIFMHTCQEADVARGKLALLDGLMQEMFKNPAGVNERLGRCLLCGACEANCPGGVNTFEIFLKARTILAGYLGLSPIKKILLNYSTFQSNAIRCYDEVFKIDRYLDGFAIRIEEIISKVLLNGLSHE